MDLPPLVPEGWDSLPSRLPASWLSSQGGTHLDLLISRCRGNRIFTRELLRGLGGWWTLNSSRTWTYKSHFEIEELVGPVLLPVFGLYFAKWEEKP